LKVLLVSGPPVLRTSLRRTPEAMVDSKHDVTDESTIAGMPRVVQAWGRRPTA
jgi:hypothetical protein